MPYSEPLVGAQAAQIFFDAVKYLDLRQAFLRDWGRAGLGDIMQFAAGMGPAIGQCHVLRGAFEQTVIASIAIHLQDAAEALQDFVRVLARPTGRVGKGHTGRIITAPWPVITGKGPEVPGFGAFAPRCQDRCHLALKCENAAVPSILGILI